EKSQKLAQALEATGKVDLLNISGGHGGNSNSYIIAPMYVPPGSISIPLASGIKQVVKSIPVVACSRINDPTIADRVIADDHCDLVGMVRGLIADPEFGNKAREGMAEDIRLCIGCNQGCSINGRPDCTQNYVAGRETTEIAKIKQAPRKKKVMVVGGGPAGMEAARVAAQRGHEVTLYEKDSHLGGRINILSRAPGREEFNQVIRYLTIQLPKSGVRLRLNTEVTLERVMQEKPDAVIIATGSRDYTEPVPGSETSRVVNPSQILRGEVEPGKKVIVYENSGHAEGPTVADFLGEKGVQVGLLTSQMNIGMRWGMNIGILATQNPFIWQRLRKNGVKITQLAKIKQISGRTVTIIDVWSGDERIIDDVDTVVMATGYLPDNDLYKKLRDKANGLNELYIIGDSAAPRRSLEAIHDGYLTAFYI
ncbi:MAG TPA: FAD-dependent oxidoreductase, partial [Dehalococcoidales bacterium]|nr:FAD-dependent oxidoreductase [Dehalococcoidales bacterium]